MKGKMIKSVSIGEEIVVTTKNKVIKNRNNYVHRKVSKPRRSAQEKET